MDDIKELKKELGSLKRMLQKVIDRLPALPTEPQIEWVRIGKLMKETGLTRDKIRGIRERNEGIARRTETGQYLHNLEAYKKAS